jgi:hypothetical protein
VEVVRDLTPDVAVVALHPVINLVLFTVEFDLFGNAFFLFDLFAEDTLDPFLLLHSFLLFFLLLNLLVDHLFEV